MISPATGESQNWQLVMQSLLKQFESDESILLMYVADELPAEDRAEVEQRLANDPALRAALQGISELHGTVADALGRLDADTRLLVSEGVAVRKVGRAMRKWQIDRMAPSPPEEPIDQLRFPWWSYPLATAAAILLAFIVWWGQQDGPPQQRLARSPNESIPMTGQPGAWDWDDLLARRLQRSLWSGYEPNGLQIEAESMVSAEEPLSDVEAIFMDPALENETTW